MVKSKFRNNVISRAVLPPLGDVRLARVGQLVATFHTGLLARASTITSKTGPLAQLSWVRTSFILCVAVPSVIAFLYFAIFDTNEFVSEARIAVRSAEGTTMQDLSTQPDNSRSGMSSIGSMLSGVKSASQDAFVVADYMRSRSVIDDIGGKGTLERIYSKPEVDWLSRLPRGSSSEDIHVYWKDKVTATIDTLSSIVTLHVRAFSPKDAKELTQLIVGRSENLINEMSERSRADALKRAEVEIKLARTRLRAAQEAMLDVRNNSSIVDPKASATSIEEMIGKLTREKLQLENNRAAMFGVVVGNSPTQRVLNAQIEGLDKQIKELREQLTSKSGSEALSTQIAKFEDAELEMQFSQKLYSIAQAEYERARMEQARQQLYVVTIVRPTLAEQVAYPRIFLDTFLIFSAFFILWSMVILVAASIRDHVG